METEEKLIAWAKPLIDLAIKEDVGSGDITTDAIIPEDRTTTALLISKADGIVAGLPVAKAVFNTIRKKSVLWIMYRREGDRVKPGDVIAELKGNYRTLLTGERIALNFLQRMSGIATITSKFATELEGTKTKLLDTRKTLPGFRMLDKYSVKIGGGKNHRLGLFDMVMIKDNHIKIAGGILNAVKSVRDKYGDEHKIEVETTNLTEVEEALNAGADIIMLDNMSLELMSEAVSVVGDKAETEASGNVSLDNIKQIAQCGVDYISVGALTHSVKAMDISMKIK